MDITNRTEISCIIVQREFVHMCMLDVSVVSQTDTVVH